MRGRKIKQGVRQGYNIYNVCSTRTRAQTYIPTCRNSKDIRWKTGSNFWTVDNTVTSATIGNSVSIAKTSRVLLIPFFSPGRRKKQISFYPCKSTEVLNQNILPRMWVIWIQIFMCSRVPLWFGGSHSAVTTYSAPVLHLWNRTGSSFF